MKRYATRTVLMHREGAEGEGEEEREKARRRRREAKKIQ